MLGDNLDSMLPESNWHDIHMECLPAVPFNHFCLTTDYWLCSRACLHIASCDQTIHDILCRGSVSPVGKRRLVQALAANRSRASVDTTR